MVRMGAISGSRLIGLDGAAHAFEPLLSRWRSGRSCRRSSGSVASVSSRMARQSSDAVEIALQMRRRRLGPFVAGGGDGDQVAGEVAAVDAET